MKLVHAVVACLVGAGLALYAATRVWSVQVTTRPGLPDLRTESTGAAEQPWMLALAVVALAGAGALLATRGLVRRGLGGLLVLAGLGLAVAAVAARIGLDPGAAGAAAAAGPAACVAGGVLIIAGGLGAARRGGVWPAMGARYERRQVPPSSREAAAHSGPSAAAGPGGSAEPANPGPPAGPAGSAASAGSPETTSSAGSAGTANSAGSAGSVSSAGSAGSDSSAGSTGSTSSAESAGSAGSTGSTSSAGYARSAADNAGRGQVSPAPEAGTPADYRAAWDALDRGDDPTAG